MTQHKSKIAIDNLYHFINNLPPQIIIKDFTSVTSPVSRSRQAIMDYYVTKVLTPTEDCPYDFHYECKHMTKTNVTKLGYIYKRLISILQCESTDSYLDMEQWFIRQIISHMINTGNKDFRNCDFDLNEIWNDCEGY